MSDAVGGALMFLALVAALATGIFFLVTGPNVETVIPSPHKDNCHIVEKKDNRVFGTDTKTIKEFCEMRKRND